MKVRYSFVISTTFLVLTLGCQGGRQDLPVSEGLGAGEPFIFAESSVLNIDSDMMAEKLLTLQLPGGAVRKDSVTALKAVYMMLADSFLIREARNFDLKAESPSLYEQYQNLLNNRLLRQMYTNVIADSVTVTDSMVRAGYDDRKEAFHLPDQYRARHIVIDGEGLRYSDDSLKYKDMSRAERDSAAYGILEEIHQRLLAGENFDTLAILYSQDENTRQSGGDLGYFQLGQMVHPFDSAVEHTPAGEMSGIIKTRFGWHVIRVEEFRAGHYQPLDSVYAQLKDMMTNEMLMERSTRFIDSLRENADIVFDTAALNTPDSLHKGEDIMAFVNSGESAFRRDTVYFMDYRQQVPLYRRNMNIEGELSFESKTEILRAASVQPLLVQAAKKLGFLDHPAVVEWTQDKLDQYSMSILRTRLMESSYEPTEEEMREYYDSHLDDYQIERPVSVQHIVFEDSALAEYVRDLLMSGIDFMEMVDKYYPGDQDIKRAAADLGAIGPDDMPASFYQEAMRVPVGSISHPVKTKFGYHLIKVLNRQYSQNFEQAKAKIEPILQDRHRIDALRQYVESHLGSAPKIHWKYLDRLYFPQGTTMNLGVQPSAAPGINE